MKLSSNAGISYAAPSSAPSRRAPDSQKTSPAPKNRASDAATAVARTPVAREVVIERKPRLQRDGDDSAPKKRVRLKPETPEQLLERLRNPQLSLHEASILLRVSRATVRRYADSGRLGCQRTPGGQRRFFLRDIENFYRQLKLKR